MYIGLLIYVCILLVINDTGDLTFPNLPNGAVVFHFADQLYLPVFFRLFWLPFTTAYEQCVLI